MLYHGTAWHQVNLAREGHGGLTHTHTQYPLDYANLEPGTQWFIVVVVVIAKRSLFAQNLHFL